MSENKKIKVETSGPIWLIGWLFTLGFVQMGFWKAVLAILIWPYFLGVAVADKLG